MARHHANEMSLRLATIPGIGVITATAMVATVVGASAFKSGRHFAAWIGLSAAAKRNRRQGPSWPDLEEEGEPYLRRLLVLGATAVVHYARNKPDFAGVGKRAVGTSTGARRDDRRGQQACARCLGYHAAWRVVRERSFGIAANDLLTKVACQRRAKNIVRFTITRIGRSDNDVMASGR